MAITIDAPDAPREELLAAYSHKQETPTTVLPGEEPAAEPEVKPEVEVETTGEVEAGDVNEGGEEDGGDEGTTTRKKKGGFQRRIESLQRKNEELNQKIAELSRSQAPEKPAVATGRPVQDDFEDLDTYFEALSDWKVQDALRKKDQEMFEMQAKQKADQQQKLLSNKIEIFRSKTPDFDETIAEMGDVVVPPVIQSLLFESDKSAEVIYHLAKNPDVFEDMCSMTPYQTAKAFGVLEKTLSEPKAKATQKPSAAGMPAPITPVAARGEGVAEPDNMTLAEYRRYRSQQ